MTHHVERALERSLQRKQSEENGFNGLKRITDALQEEKVCADGEMMGTLRYLVVNNVQKFATCRTSSGFS